MDFRLLEKRDLHVHLNGCIPPSVTAELLRLYSVDLPQHIVPERLDEALQVREPVQSMDEYFLPWHVLKRLPKGRRCLRQMIDSALETLAADNVVYAELRNSPFNIADLNNISLEETVAWLVEDLQVAANEIGVEARWIISLSRFNFNTDRATALLQAIARENDGTIVGVDLSGDENQPIPLETSRLFRRAKDELGLGISIHAGETGSSENVRWTIDECRADRIAHALAAAQDRELMDAMARRGVCVEVCLTTNYLTGQVPDLNEHPVIHFIDHDVPFALCSDNPSVNNSPLSNEYEKFVQVFGRHDLISSMHSVQKRFSFT